MFKKSTITLLFLMIATIAAAQEGPKLKFDEPDDVFWDNRFGGIGANGLIHDVAHVRGDSLFIAGDFTQINGVLAPGLALWTGTEWQAVPEGNKNTVGILISDIEYSNGYLYILNKGSSFANFDQRVEGEILKYDVLEKDLKIIDSSNLPDSPSFDDLTQTNDGTIIASSVEVINSSGAGTTYNLSYYYVLDFFGTSLLSKLQHQISGNSTIPKLKNGRENRFISFPIDGDIEEGNSTWENPQIVEINVNGGYGVLTNKAVFQDVSLAEYTGSSYLVYGTPIGQSSMDFAEYNTTTNTWDTELNYYSGYDYHDIEAITRDTVFIVSYNQLDNFYFIERFENEFSASVNILYSDYENELGLTIHKVNNGVAAAGAFRVTNSFDRQYVEDITILPSNDFLSNFKNLGQSDELKGINGPVYTIEEVGDSLFIGGEFDMAGNTFTSAIAVLHNDTWSSIGTFEGGDDYYGTGVYYIYRFDKYLFVGGNFNSITHNGIVYHTNNIATYNFETDTWGLLGTGIQDVVYDIQKIENAVYVYGFNLNEWRSTLYTYRSGYWSNRIPMDFSDDVTVMPEDILAVNDKLYVTGFFEYNENRFDFNFAVLDVNGLREIKLPDEVKNFYLTSRLSELDGEVLFSAESDFLSDGSGDYPIFPIFKVVGDTVESFIPSPSVSGFTEIIGSGDRLFGFNANHAGSEGFNGIASWNGEEWERLGNGVSPYFFRDVPYYSIGDAHITSDGRLAVAGTFDLAGNKPASNFTFWSGETTPSTPITISFRNTPVIEFSESLTFQWTNANYSSEFEFELSDQEDFSNLIVGITGISENKVEVRTGFEPSVIYYWRVRAVNPNGVSSWSDIGTFEMASPVSAEQNEAVVQFELMQNYPNPFNPSTNIQFSIPTSQLVTLEIFDVSGRKVATLLNNEHLSAGIHTRVFNADRLASGVYFYRIATDNQVLLKKMLLIK